MRDAVPASVNRRIVLFACGAPSVHNTQPWAWRLRPDGFDLYADHHRRLPVADPSGRELVISCGAALHHCRSRRQGPGVGGDRAAVPGPVGARAARRGTPGARGPAALGRRRPGGAAGPEHRPPPLHVVADPRRAPRAARRRGPRVGDRCPGAHRRHRALPGRPPGEPRRPAPGTATPTSPPSSSCGSTAAEARASPAQPCPTDRRRTRAAAAASAWARSRTPAATSRGRTAWSCSAANGTTPAAWLRAGEGLSALWLHAVRTRAVRGPAHPGRRGRRDPRRRCGTRCSAGSPYRCCWSGWAGRRSAAASWCRPRAVRSTDVLLP